jgi:diguanylate cyclase (GGDEF)-like protein/PAS domain S-box-containing protein
MKRKIIISMLVLFGLTLTGTLFSVLIIRDTSQSINRLIKLHQIEDLRKNLLMAIQTAQSELYTVHTAMGHKVDTIAENIINLEDRAKICLDCHHSPEIQDSLLLVQSKIKDYQESLSYYITASANKDNIEKLQFAAASKGNDLLGITEKMSEKATAKLESMTKDALNRVNRVQAILFMTAAATLIAGFFAAVHLARSLTRPIETLVTATRAIASGQFGYSVALRDKTEFGELAEHFNAMSSGLQESYERLQTEIAERRQTQAALMQSEDFLKTIYMSIWDPFCILDRNLTIVQSNHAYAVLKGKSIGQLSGKICYRELHQADLPCSGCIVQKTFDEGEPSSKEKEDVAADGSSKWFEIHTYPIFDNEGEVSHVIEYTRDITSRKEAEHALRRSEERYALSAQGANDGLWDWNLIENRIFFSPRWKIMLGYSDGEIGSDPHEWFERIHPEDRDHVRVKIDAHVYNHEAHFECECRMRHKDGTYLWMLSRGLAVRDALGKASRMAGSQTDITARKVAEEQLLHEAFHDALTSLPNRSLFMDRLRHVMDRSSRDSGLVYAVFFIDVDRFKTVNDSLGHIIGDQLLVQIAKRLISSLRPGDTVARLGGDEFAVLLENVRGAADVLEVAGRIQQNLAPSFTVGDQHIFITESIGIALKSDRYACPENVLRDADIAMYQAKAKGKARIEFFDASMHSEIMERLYLESDLRAALESKDQFFLNYQPIIDLDCYRIMGFEALVRWNHPRRGIVSPMDFIPIAEETGMIISLGDWILMEACLQLKKWQDQFQTDTPLHMSVNVSSRQFMHPGFIDKIAALLEELKIKKGCVAIEVTESIIMDDIEKAVETMSRLKDLGVHVHIDDFGVGYSSLSYLHSFPVSALKVDRSFVSNLHVGAENREIIKTIVSLAKALNLKVIAEGVETLKQLSEMRDLNCLYAQGYLFSKPMRAEEVGEWMKQFEFLSV